VRDHEQVLLAGENALENALQGFRVERREALLEDAQVGRTRIEAAASLPMRESPIGLAHQLLEA
jgi:hypothetical protein